MNTGKKHFSPTRGNGVAGIREDSKGGPGEQKGYQARCRADDSTQPARFTAHTPSFG